MSDGSSLKGRESVLNIGEITSYGITDELNKIQTIRLSCSSEPGSARRNQQEERCIPPTATMAPNVPRRTLRVLKT
ncbi:hypothetical protein [Caballeronia hypogeia]|uniref:hypothetical protein n=1 Tax=Caballeronia hypogeia TaxID=1777140 RepID=UPI0012FDF3A2|nr:hypothetical protein [Caballeronia hypogeia]